MGWTTPSMFTATTRGAGAWAKAEKVNAAIAKMENLRKHLQYIAKRAGTGNWPHCCTLASMTARSSDSNAGTKEGVRILRLIGPFVLQAVNEFQSVSRAGNDPVITVDLSDLRSPHSAAMAAMMGLHVC